MNERTLLFCRCHNHITSRSVKLNYPINDSPVINSSYKNHNHLSGLSLLVEHLIVFLSYDNNDKHDIFWLSMSTDYLICPATGLGFVLWCLFRFNYHCQQTCPHNLWVCPSLLESFFSAVSSPY